VYAAVETTAIALEGGGGVLIPNAGEGRLKCCGRYAFSTSPRPSLPRHLSLVLHPARAGVFADASRLRPGGPQRAHTPAYLPVAPA
jgi:hypothetical protein